MRSLKHLFVLLFLVAIIACESKTDTSSDERTEYAVSIKNKLDFNRTDVLVTLSPSELPDVPAEGWSYKVTVDGKEIPSQYNSKGRTQGLLFMLDELAAASEVSAIIELVPTDSLAEYPKRTQAELSIREGGEWDGKEYKGGAFVNVDSLYVPEKHDVHSWYIRYEGPGWESDKVGYRFYLDRRNATDIWGKTTDNMVLQKVGQVGDMNYHEMKDWGMDILKVGESLGIGSPATLVDGVAVHFDSVDQHISKVLSNGVIYSSVQTDYQGWTVADIKLDISSEYSIHAGSRLTHHRLSLGGELENIATGIGKNEKGKYVYSEGSASEFGYLYTFGPQSYNNDNLGLAVFFANSDMMEIREDEYNYLVSLKADSKEVSYYFLAAWELEPEGIKSEEEFDAYVKQVAKELANPVVAEVVKD